MIQALALDLPRFRRTDVAARTLVSEQIDSDRVSDRLSDHSVVNREGSDRESERVSETSKGQN
jgi:hypothetical protein